MKKLNENKSGIIGLALDGKIEVGETVYSNINNCAYKIVESKNHQGSWIGVEEVEE